MFKKWIYSLLTAAMIASVIPIQAGAAEKPTRPIWIVKDNNILTLDAKPYSDNGRVMVPIRAIAEAIGAQVDWKQANQTASFTLEKKVVTIKVGSNKAYVNGVEKALDAKSAVKQSRVFVPLRFVSEALGASVFYKADPYFATVTIQYGPKRSQLADVYEVNPDIPKELYEYPYLQNYLGDPVWNNKKMVEEQGVYRMEEYSNTAKGYMESFFNVDYKTLDRNKQFKDIRYYFLPGTTWIADDGVTRSVNDHINYWLDNIKSKQISIEAEFITDSSLVYGSLFYNVRGRLKYRVNHITDIKWLKNFTKFGDVQVGKWYYVDIDLELRQGFPNNNVEVWPHSKLTIRNEVHLSTIKEDKQR